MLWYKSWLETRWRFFVGLALLICSAFGIVLIYPKMLQLLPLAPAADVGGEIARRVREAVELSREYRGYVWSQWFRQSLMQMWTLFAVLIGTGGLLSRSTGAALFTLSLPISRERLISIRATTGLAELFVLAVVPSLLIPLISPSVGESYSVLNAGAHGLCLFITGTVFYSLAVLLSTIFEDVWKPLIIALMLAILLATAEPFVPLLTRIGLFRVMAGEQFFRTGVLPWLGLVLSAGASGLMLYAATVSIARKDF